VYLKRLFGLSRRLGTHHLPHRVYQTGKFTAEFKLAETEIDVYGQVTVKLKEEGKISRDRYTPVSYCFHFMCTRRRSTEIMRFEKGEGDRSPHYHDRAHPGIHFRNPEKYGLDVEGFCSVLALRSGEYYADTCRTPMEAKDGYNSLWREERKKLGWG
jgi:hypothetical protein